MGYNGLVWKYVFSFPNLPPAEMEKVLAQLGTASETALVRSFRQWVQTRMPA